MCVRVCVQTFPSTVDKKHYMRRKICNYSLFSAGFAGTETSSIHNPDQSYFNSSFPMANETLRPSMQISIRF